VFVSYVMRWGWFRRAAAPDATAEKPAAAEEEEDENVLGF
jgi:hypothetical protein